MSKHAPGPWRIQVDESIYGPVTRVLDALGDIVCDDQPYHPKALDADNASLIAAAPEMLDVLQKIHAHGYVNMSDHDMVRDVIAKATGASNEP